MTLETRLTALAQDIAGEINLVRNEIGGGGSGTVTSVAVSGGDGIEVDSGSPITGAGTIALGVNAAALRVHLGVNAEVELTQAAYDSLSPPDANTTYYITDA